VEHRQQTAKSGFDHHLTKPVDPAALTRLLATWSTPTDAALSGPVTT
jgi:hypothetical protein